MSSVAIITSAAYAAEEICALYGELPPAFLPFGSGRLYQKQVAILKKYYDRVIITIPDNFEPTYNPFRESMKWHLKEHHQNLTHIVGNGSLQSEKFIHSSLLVVFL